MQTGDEPRANYNTNAKVKVRIVTNKIITLNVIFATITWKWATIRQNYVSRDRSVINFTKFNLCYLEIWFRLLFHQNHVFDLITIFHDAFVKRQFADS